MSLTPHKTGAEKFGAIIGVILANIFSPLFLVSMVWDAPMKFLNDIALHPKMALAVSKTITLTMAHHPLETIAGGLGALILLVLVTKLYIHWVASACAAISQSIASTTVTAYEAVLVSLASTQTEA